MSYESPERPAPDAREIAEVLWLAAQLARAADDAPARPAVRRPHRLPGLTGQLEPDPPRRRRDAPADEDSAAAQAYGATRAGIPGPRTRGP